MTLPLPILIPLLNPNEPEAILASVYVREGQHVSMGEMICTVETTKSTADVTSETEGYVTGLRFNAGQTVRAGEVLCTLAETPAEEPSLPAELAPVHSLESDLPRGLRITQPALALARTYNLELGKLPTGALVTESMVRSLLGNPPAVPVAGQNLETPESPSFRINFPLPAAPFDPTVILVYGGGGHGKIIIDLLKAQATYHIAGILDDGRKPGELILGVPVLGGAEMLPRLLETGVRLAVNAIGGISNIAVRIDIFRRLAEAGFSCPAIAHPTALIEPSASLAPGSQVLAHAYLGSDARAGYGAIISTGAIVSHDCLLGNYANVSPGAILAGEVHVGDGVLIGMGVTVNLGVKIGPGARIGNGATVNIDVPEGGIVRAGTIWPK